MLRSCLEFIPAFYKECFRGFLFVLMRSIAGYVTNCITIFRRNSKQLLTFFSKPGLSKPTNQLRRENKILPEANEKLESELSTLLGHLAIPSVRNMIFAVADALISGQPVPISSGGGGGNSDSDLRWDGRRLDEEETYRRRCLLSAFTNK